MTGADIIAALLRASPALNALVPVPNIKIGRLPDGVVLPALLITTTSSVDRQTLKRGATVRVTDRVSVTVRAASHRDRATAIRLIRLTCAGRTGSVGGGTSVSVLTAGASPDLNGPSDSYERTQDFRVSYLDAAA